MLIALEELGYDGSDHRSQAISEELLSWADTIVVMGNVHERFIADRFPKYSSKVQNWRIKDPHFEKGMDTHREVVRQIQKRIQAEFC